MGEINERLNLSGKETANFKSDAYLVLSEAVASGELLAADLAHLIGFLMRPLVVEFQGSFGGQDLAALLASIAGLRLRLVPSDVTQPLGSELGAEGALIAQVVFLGGRVRSADFSVHVPDAVVEVTPAVWAVVTLLGPPVLRQVTQQEPSIVKLQLARIDRADCEAAMGLVAVNLHQVARQPPRVFYPLPAVGAAGGEDFGPREVPISHRRRWVDSVQDLLDVVQGFFRIGDDDVTVRTAPNPHLLPGPVSLVTVLDKDALGLGLEGAPPAHQVFDLRISAASFPVSVPTVVVELLAAVRAGVNVLFLSKVNFLMPQELSCGAEFRAALCAPLDLVVGLEGVHFQHVKQDEVGIVLPHVAIGAGFGERLDFLVGPFS